MDTDTLQWIALVLLAVAVVFLAAFPPDHD